MINKFDFYNETQEYGKFLCSSPNGQNHVFKKTLCMISDSESIADEFLQLHIMNISVYGIRKVKTINIEKLFKNIDQGKE